MQDEKTGISWPLMQRELTSYFGDPRDPSFAKEYLTTLDLTEFAMPNWKRIYCNWVMADPLRKACLLIAERGLQNEILTYDGCFNIRAMKGNGGNLSVHSWGLAIDLNAAENPFGRRLVTTWSDAFVQCFLDAGFEWGGAWDSIKDAMHFQACWTRTWSTEQYAAHVWTPVAIITPPVEVPPVEVPPVEVPSAEVPPVEVTPPVPAPAEPWWLQLIKGFFKIFFGR